MKHFNHKLHQAGEYIFKGLTTSQAIMMTCIIILFIGLIFSQYKSKKGE